MCGSDSPQEIRCRHDRSDRWGQCDTGGYRARPVQPSSLLVARITARDTRPYLPRPCCERFGPHPMDPSFQRRRASRLPAGRSLLRHGCFDLFTDEEGDHRSLVRRSRGWNAARGHTPRPRSRREGASGARSIPFAPTESADTREPDVTPPFARSHEAAAPR